MNIQERIERIEALEAEFNERLKALKAEVQQEQEFPQDGDLYWFIDDEGGMFSAFYKKHYLDINRQKIGNIFRTKDQAEFAVEKLKVEAELRKYSRPFKYGKPNRNIILTDNENVSTAYWYKKQTQGGIYFESEEKAQQAISTVGEERIKKYIFGVED
ncbi:hypothetical protein [Aerococcus sp. 1KP-2016]|uniref:hypothetical protein n=1 Tax=Aerococcus sp. 1KP-2016 TaxID=1981982 RepID=UPI000B987D97|nr:hypothetical protein [Aerococcus sp. 1KP-2016]OYQ68286.1 hypothetical protein B9P78_00310 [Aerococcus sp. 1KP-2016]